MSAVEVAAALTAVVALAWPISLVLRRWRALQPTPGGRLRRAAQALSVERRLLSLLRPYVPTVLLGLLITAAITAVGLAKPWPTKVLVDDVLGDGRFLGLTSRVSLVLVVAATLVLFLAGGALGVLQVRVLYDLTQRLIRDLRGDLFAHLSRLSLQFHDERGVGDSAYRVSADTYALHSLLLGGLVPVTSAVLTFGGIFVVMARIDPFLAVLSLLSVPGAFVITRRYGRRIRVVSKDVRERESDVYTQAEQTLSGIRTVQAFARESYEAERFVSRADASRGAMLRLVTEQTVFSLAVDAVLGLGLALVTYVAASRALDGQLTVGEVLVFLAYAGILYGPVSELAGVVGEVQEAAAGAQRVFEVLDVPGPVEAPGATAPAPRAQGRIALEVVRFEYSAQYPVLREVDVVVPAGTTVALVGPTGAGKSTILSLLLRLYDPTAGRVTLDGHDVRDLPVAWLREQIALVPQDPVLFAVSVRENIRYGRLDATDEEVEEAARQANILDELLARDERGLDAPVGDRGVTLSGGQRQRVAIARAFLRDAPVILLDEPSSALDAATERLVMEAVWRLFEGRTCVAIAHRLATVHRADRILVVDGGRVVQEGSHRDLIRRRGLYRELHATRFGQEPTAAGAARRRGAQPATAR